MSDSTWDSLTPEEREASGKGYDQAPSQKDRTFVLPADPYERSEFYEECGLTPQEIDAVESLIATVGVERAWAHIEALPE